MTNTPNPARSLWRGTAVWLGVLFALNLLLWAVAVFYVPGQKKMFDEYALALPSLTRSVITASMFYARYWFFIAPTFISAMSTGVLVGRHVFRRPTPGTVFAWACAFALTATLVVILLGLSLPAAKLAEGMNK